MAFKRVLMPMLVMGIILGLSGMAFAADVVQCTITAGPAGVPGAGSTSVATATGHTEPIGAGVNATDGTVPVQGGGGFHIECDNPGPAFAAPSGVGVLTINLGVPITNTTGFPAVVSAIRVANGTGAFAGAPLPNVGIGGLNNSGGQIVIGIGTGAASVPGGGAAAGAASLTAAPTTGISFTAGQLSGFDVLGILVSLNGSNKTTVTATMTITPGAGFVPGPGASALSTQVIDSVQPGLLDPTVPSGTLPAVVTAPFGLPTITGGAAVLSSNGGVIKGNFTIKVQEAYSSFLKSSTQFNGGATFPAAGGSDTETSIQFTNVPAGFGITGCVVQTTAPDGTSSVGDGTPTLSSTFVTQAAPILTVNWNTGLDQTVNDVIWVTCTVNAGTASLPLATNITVQVFSSPIGAALSSGATPAALVGLTTGQIPRYQQTLQPATPLTVVVFPSSSTTMLIPFSTVGTGYNTGIAVANTTNDVAVFPAYGAVAQNGTLTFWLYNNDSTVKSYTTTTGAPGVGLTSAGVLNAGGTYAVNLSEIAAKAGASASFTGYVFITANFTNAHGAATVYVNATGAATLSTPVLYVPTPSVAVTRNTAETLGF